MMEMREFKLILGNLSVNEQLSEREKAGKLGCSKNDRACCFCHASVVSVVVLASYPQNSNRQNH